MWSPANRARPFGNSGFADSSLSHINRAIHWMRDHYAEPFRVSELARMSGVSVSAVHRNFEAVAARARSSSKS